jgi:glycosyltransferase involved in cell wall biosynthesis
MNNTEKLDLVSVIIPTFGRAEYIVRAVESVLKQDYSEIEIIVIDDNGKGTDNQIDTELRLSPYLDFDNFLYYPRACNGGGGVARNDGIEMSTGSYITFLDDDDEYMPLKIKRQLSELTESESDICLCGAYYYNKNNQLERYVGRPVGRTLKEFLLEGIALTPMIMVRRNVLDAVGGFENTPRFQDHILMIKILSEGFLVSIINDRLYKCYRHSGDRISTSPKSYEGFLKKHEIENRVSIGFESKFLRKLKLKQELELLPFSTYGRAIQRAIRMIFFKEADRVSIIKVMIKLTISRCGI